MFYIVMAIVRPGVTVDDVQRTLQAISYYRIAPNVWVVHALPWDNSTTLFAQLEALVKPSGRILVSKLNLSDRNGWMDKAFWTWLTAQQLAS